MRIALVSGWLWTECQRYGVEGGFVFQTAEALASHGHEVIALTQSRAVVRAEDISLGRLGARVLPSDRRSPWCSLGDRALKLVFGPRKLLTDALALHRFLKERGPFDAIWAQSEEPDAMVVAIAAQMGPVPPSLVTVQAVRWTESRRGELCFRRRRSLGFTLRSAQLVAANSAMAQDWLHGAYGVPKARLARYVVSLTPAFLAPTAQARQTTPPSGPPRIVFLGALNATKGPDHFLRMARVVAGQFPTATFIMIGGETERAPYFFRTLAQLATVPELKGKLEQRGALNATQIVAELARATVVVCPSRVDTLSRATVEALACGVPVVVSPRVGAGALLERDGSGLVAPLTTEGLAQAVARVLQEPRFGEQARAQATQIATEYGAAAAGRTLHELLTGLVKK